MARGREGGRDGQRQGGSGGGGGATGKENRRKGEREQTDADGRTDGGGRSFAMEIANLTPREREILATVRKVTKVADSSVDGGGGRPMDHETGSPPRPLPTTSKS